jgi:hypothetical protein
VGLVPTCFYFKMKNVCRNICIVLRMQCLYDKIKQKQFAKLEFDEQLSYAPNLAMFSDRAYIDNNKERR